MDVACLGEAMEKPWRQGGDKGSNLTPAQVAELPILPIWMTASSR